LANLPLSSCTEIAIDFALFSPNESLLFLLSEESPHDEKKKIVRKTVKTEVEIFIII
jgi:hypothetical protein